MLYINSFTKKLLPSLRVGYLVASDALMPSLLSAKRLGTLGNAWISEAIVAEFLGRGYYDTHLATLQRELDQRYTRCLELLRERMPDGVRWTTPGGGPTLWLEVPKNISLERLGARLQAHGVNIESAADAFDGRPHLHGFRISYAFLPPDTLDRAVGLVSEALVAEAQAAVGGGRS